MNHVDMISEADLTNKFGNLGMMKSTNYCPWSREPFLTHTHTLTRTHIHTHMHIDNLFVMADKDGDGCINPIEAKNFFPQFGLPNQFLSLVSTHAISLLLPSVLCLSTSWCGMITYSPACGTCMRAM